MNSHTTNAYPITKEVYNYLLPVYERGRMVERAGAELNGLKAMYRLPAVYYRVVLTREGPHVIGTHLDTSAYIEDLDGFFARIEAKNKFELRKAIKKTVIFMTFK